MITQNINFKNFVGNKNKFKISKKLKILLKQNIPLLTTLSKKYKYNYNKKNISKFKKYKEVNLIGMGGSILGAQAIYDFLNFKVKKKFSFINNLDLKFFNNYKKKKNYKFSYF